jgi:hypothetical protein
MSRRISLLSIVALFLLASSQLRAADATPTPTPRPKPSRKLGGGAFGTSAAPTPAAAAGGGSLADVVKKAQDEAPAPSGRRGRGLVITNESLRRSEPASSAPALSIAGAPPSKPGVGATPTPAPIPDYRDASGRTEADWRQRAAEARQREEQAKADVETARAEVRRLENDFYAWSDGNYRERVIRPAWDQARERLKTLESEVGAAREALDALEEEARKSGTPPGWLR